MQISIDNNEMEAMQCACAEMNLAHLVVKKHKDMKDVEIRWSNGKDISPVTAYYFCRFMLGYIERENARKELESLLNR